MVPGVNHDQHQVSEELQAFLGTQHGSMTLINGAWTWQDSTANDSKSYDVYLNSRAHVHDDVLFDESSAN